MQTVILLLIAVVALLVLAVCYLIGVIRGLTAIRKQMDVWWDEYCRKGGVRDGL